MKKKMVKRFAAAMVTGLLLAGSMMTAMATETTATTAAASTGNSFTFEKYLVMDQNATVPAETFNFTITAGEAVSAAAGKVEILAGVVGNNAPTIGTANFTSYTDALYTEGTDSVNLETGKGYAKKEVSVNFSGVTFDKPGVYRYVINETAGSRDGITYADAPLYLDVYVENNDDSSNTAKFKITQKVLRTGTEAESLTGGELSDKTEGITNTYTTNDFTVTKKVTGNQGDKTKKFNFSITVTGTESETYKYEIGTLSGSTFSKNNSATSGILTSGTATKISLADGETVKVYGLSANDTYVVAETDYATEGYTTSWSRTGNADETSTDNSAAGTHVFTTATSTEESTAIGTTDDAITFTNDKSVTTPTGIALTIAPYAVMVIVAAGLAFVFLRKKRTIEE